MDIHSVFKFRFFDQHALRVVATQQHSMNADIKLSDARAAILALIDADLLAFTLPTTGERIPVLLEQDVPLHRIASAGNHINCITALRRGEEST